MIYRFQPFAIDKSQFGVVYNAHCAMVPGDKDWICITDWDTMPLSALTYSVIDRAIERYPDTDIFGAMTNRIAYEHQRLTKEMDEHDSIKHHIRIAEIQAKLFRDGECKDAQVWINGKQQRDQGVAGFFLLFRKSYWEKNKFTDTIIDPDGNLFDYNFCRGAKKIRIILGAYIYHQYRLMSPDHRRKDHLKVESHENNN